VTFGRTTPKIITIVVFTGGVGGSVASDGPGIEYRRGSLDGAGRTIDETSDPLLALQRTFGEDAAQTGSCFGLVPQNSAELAQSYLEFHVNVLHWLTSLRANLTNAGVTMVGSERNYNAADQAPEAPSREV
jgi:hypothetical protein